MTFGLQFTNPSGTVILDSQYARLCVICSGRYAPTQENNLGSVTSFPNVITTQEPPLIFIRPDNTTVSAGFGTCKVYGSPGSWTGFYIRAYGSVYQPTGKYFAAAFRAQPLGSFGMRLFGADSSLLFDSATPAAQFTRAAQNWTFVKSVALSQNAYANYYSTPFTFDANEYQLMNTHGMDKISRAVTGRYIYSNWDFPNSILYTVAVGQANPYDFHMSSIFAKLVS